MSSAPDPHRLWLWAGDRSHAILVQEDTACQLIRWVTGGDGIAAAGTWQSLVLADPSFAAWLIDRWTAGSMRSPVSVSSEASKRALVGAGDSAMGCASSIGELWRAN